MCCCRTVVPHSAPTQARAEQEEEEEEEEEDLPMRACGCTTGFLVPVLPK
jgi:hypothetical protein